MSKILVVGDVMIDHHLYEGERNSPTTDTKRGVVEKVQLGGAYSIVELFEAARRRLEKERAAQDKQYKEKLEQYQRDKKQHAAALKKRLPKGAPKPIKPEPPKEPKYRELPETEYGVELGVSIPAINGSAGAHHSFAVWKPFPKENKKGSPLVWRTNLLMGYGNQVDAAASDAATPKSAANYKLAPRSRVAAPTILVLDDAGNQFRHDEHRACWQLRDRMPPEWIVLKMSYPAAQGDLFTELRDHHAERVVCVVSADELRRECIELSRGLSWEESIEDLRKGLLWHSSLKQLLKFKHLVVTFGLDGALWIDHTRRTEPVATLVCDAGGAEREFAADTEGDAFGYHSLLVVSIVRTLALHLKQDDDRPDLANALASGLTAMRDLRENGHGEVGKALPDGFPVDRLAAALEGPNGKFAQISFNWHRDTDCPGRWRIVESMQVPLRSSARPSLLGLARQVVLKGTEVLKRVPHAEFGALFTADRHEIEALRTIRQLMRGYRDGGKAKKPLSIGVFGPPGAGKSFGVQEISNHLFGKEAWLDFNLSQFADSKDLVGAFHRVRDIVLSGTTPVVFWDEFDSREYYWLQYLLAPMQDGKFQDGPLTHNIGKCVFVFAGGTSHTYADFGPDKQDQVARNTFRLRKGPDFHSRLDAYYDVLGPNQRRLGRGDDPQRDKNDVCYPLRRAIILRAKLKCSADEYLDIDSDLVNALLEIKDYTHGARSLEKLVSSMRDGGDAIRRSALPSLIQSAMHVDIGDLALILARNQAYQPAEIIEPIAKVIHKTYYDKSRAEGWKLHPTYDKPYNELGQVEKEENRAAARRIPELLGLIGLEIQRMDAGVRRSADEDAENEEVRQHLKHHLELLAEAEHDGWMAHRKRNGWRYGETRDDDRKIHNALRKYAELSPEDKKKDRNSVKNFPKFVHESGFRIAFVSHGTCEPEGESKAAEAGASS